MFKIENGREYFYQWDANQRLIAVLETIYCIKGGD